MQSILSIQSWVAYGHVGNAAALFALQLLGFEAWGVNTVQFSNHTGYGAWRGQVMAPDHIRDVLAGIEARGVLPNCAAVLTGYVGDPDLGAVVLDAVAAVKRANPAALWCCDPVMGDTGRGFFVRPGVPEFFRDGAMALADIATPNLFELEYLAGRALPTPEAVAAAAVELRERGPGLVLVTSLPGSTPATIGMLAAHRDGVFLVETPRFGRGFDGAGDTTAAVFLAAWLREPDPAKALALTAAAIYALLETTERLGIRELALVAAQHEMTAPSRKFAVRQVG